MIYNGEVLGFKYSIEKETEAEFEIWLETKLRKYLLPDDSVQKRVLERILGIDIVKTDITTSKDDIEVLKTDIEIVKSDIEIVKTDIGELQK